MTIVKGHNGRLVLWALTALFLIVFVTAMPANAHRITFSSCGIQASSAGLGINAIAGQPVIGIVSDGNHVCQLGFWTPSAEVDACCIGTKGNVDGSSDDIVDISDLIFLVNYMVSDGPEPECFEEADLLPDGIIDISDLVMLVTAMFVEGEDFPACGDGIEKAVTADSDQLHAILETVYYDGRTTVYLELSEGILGIHLTMSCPSDVRPEVLVEQSLEHFFGRSADTTRVLILDVEGQSAMRSDRQAILAIDGECKIIGAAVTDKSFNTVRPVLSVSKTEPSLPTAYKLSQNIPNPFNPTTEISFGLPQGGHVRLEILNILGQTVEIPLDADLPAGRHSVVWDGSSVSSGVYFYRLTTDNFIDSRKMLLLK